MGPACRGDSGLGRPGSDSREEEKVRHGAVLFLPSGLGGWAGLSVRDFFPLSSAGLMRTDLMES